MDKIVNIMVFATFIPLVHNEFLAPDYGPVPDKCHPIPELLYRQCCVFPPFFTRTVARECGAVFALKFINEKDKIAGLKRHIINGCEHWACVLKKYFLLDAEGHVDDEKYFLHLDKWVDLNPSFSNVMLNAKMNCKQTFRMSMPLSVCEFYSFQGCIRNFITVNCPDVLKTPQCSELKAFYDECKEYFQ